MEASGGVSNPSHWEEQYRTGDTPWDKNAPAPALCDFLADEKMEGSVLVPGCGVGHDVRAIAGGGACVVGLDFASAAIAAARKFPRVGGETYVCEDFFALSANHREAFDWIFEHTCFCAIDPQRRPEYVKAAAGALKEGGRLLAIFFLNPDHDEGPPYGVLRDEMDSLFNSRFNLLREWKPRHFYSGREDREILRMYQKKRAASPA